MHANNPAMAMTDVAAEAVAPLAGRPAAGTDPVKRRQILEGAQRVFNQMGFDAASMNDITRAAGVSKGTLYVYFTDKVQLFIALIEQEREKHARELYVTIDDQGDIEDVLILFGIRLAGVVCQEWVLRAQRIVLGVTERMPELGREFFERGARRAALYIQAYLDRRVADGTLDIPDTYLAAAQFLELCQATLSRPRLFGAVEGPPSPEEVRKVVTSAVRLFLAAYRRPIATA
jgi:TetR/AcrR family transcriptional regulator of autoinduction and epiphytic fitness